jgi:hypothetical protein
LRGALWRAVREPVELAGIERMGRRFWRLFRSNRSCVIDRPAAVQRLSSSPQDERGGQQPAARCHQMPWTSNEAERHTHKATTPALQQLWTKVANETLERTGDEGRAIREANAVIARQPNAGS